MSPNYPSDYSNNQNCQYLIMPPETEGPEKMFVVLEFLDFDVESKFLKVV